MKYANKQFLKAADLFAMDRKNAILSAPDTVSVSGEHYYVSSTGCDSNDGKTPKSPWQTLSRVSQAELKPGDGVFFRRGDLFRGFVKVRSGVTYAAYGCGDKPKFYGWDCSLADEKLWELYDSEHNIWKLCHKILDCGTLVFNDGEKHSRKLIPSYKNGRFVCRDNESKIFDPAQEMTQDLDLFCRYDERMTTKESRGESFPVPLIDELSFGELYLRCDKGNPGNVFAEIEAVPRRTMFQVGECDNVTIDNLCLKYIGFHAIAAGGDCVKGLHVSNCEIGWIGGTVQHYLGTDPNYPQGGRGTVTRFGNGVEIYGGCADYEVKNCYIYQVYDAGITHQITTFGKTYTMTDILYTGNLVENCVYSIEYFLEKNMGDTQSYIKGCRICDNVLRFAGFGWGQQRHNVYTPAHIKGWSYENTASDFSISGNVFDRSAYRMIHTVAKTEESCPVMQGNTYIQKLGMTLGQYGANEQREPCNISFDENAETSIKEVFGDKEAKVYFIK